MQVLNRRASDAKYYVTHREEVRASQANYYAKHREEIRASTAKYRVEHPEVNRAGQVKWRAEHPEENRANVTNYTHRKRANGGNFSRAAWEYLKTLFGHCCAYCGRRMQNLTQDHITPLSKGGWHFSGNIVPACRSCNSRKGDTCRF